MGHHNRHFAGDPHALEGVLESTNYFCEEDYAVSRYFAEFISTLTILAYVYYALVYIYGPGSKVLFSPRYDFMSISLLVLGIGSFAFHATLRQSMQFADELAMLGLVWSLLQGVLTIGTKRDRILNWLMAFCTELRSLRVKMGLPWAWVLELHGWWHVLTAVSASWFMDIVRKVQEELRDGTSVAGKDSESERLKEL
ncbi:hypothetical protein QC762_105540 [Podospora pseudocomata]|uniref:Alkaline phytoceramidase n=1 Tax=Podospora pseudocomata TaxID=2093779 RepID=A0ABR0GT10_9PEZI|nr:hypothetical protein QC762_105540 [Podospora pseudocomata]